MEDSLEKMMSSTTLHKLLQPMLVSVLFLGFFLSAFLMYFNPSTSWLSGLAQPAASTAPVSQPAITKSEKNVTIVLLWFWPFGQHTNLGDCSSLFNIEGCFITADRKFYNKSHGVVIHHRDISGDLSNLPQIKRPPFQKWIWMNMESPTHSRKYPGIQNVFNLTVSYRRDADIRTPYFTLEPAETEEDFVPPNKDKLACWIVSNWNPNHQRAKYYNQVKNHIQIHVYGGAFGKRISREDSTMIITSSKFYFSFENSIHKDYITEKVYNPLSMGTVPVVLGPPRKNYEIFIPGDAFIHVDDFASPKELAEYLLLLDKNEEMYLRYFKWRRHFKAKGSTFVSTHTCRACEYLRRHNQYQSFNNLDEWFWGQ